MSEFHIPLWPLIPGRLGHSLRSFGKHAPKNTASHPRIPESSDGVNLAKVVTGGCFICTWYCICNYTIYSCRKSLRSSQLTIIIFLVTHYIPDYRCSSVDDGFGLDVCLSLLTCIIAIIPLCSAVYSTKCFSIQKRLRWNRHHMDRPIFRFPFACATMNLLLVLICDMVSTLCLLSG
jgi:hypothetical protein